MLRIRDPGSGAFLTLDPESGMGLFRIPDPQTHIFDSLMTNFWVKSTIILSVYLFKNKIIYNLFIFVATKDVGKKKFPPLLVLLLDPGSGSRDPGYGMDKNQDPGQTSRIRNTGSS